MLAIWQFMNPMTMMIGGLLIASPIIIHLINRMRFKRIRWAAMEFLLKAQKRSRRRLIIEQMILLLLRILLILGVALLLSRLVNKEPEKDIETTPIDKEPPKATLHVIILDDSASMADRWRQEEGADRGKEVTGFDQAGKAVREFIVDIVRQDTNPHEFTIIKTSDPDQPKLFNALNDSVRAEIDTYLKQSTVQPRHFEFIKSLSKAKDLLLEAKTKNLVLHVISDFRASDWNDAAKDSLGKMFEQFEKATVQIKMHDVIPPKREQEKPVQSAENLAIIDFRPESPVVIKDMPVEFTVTVQNFSNSDKEIQVRIKVNNEDKAEGSVPMKIRANDTVTGRAVFSLNRTAPKDLNNKAETAKYDAFNLVSAQIINQTSGLAIDDVRYTVVEVRDSISLLLLDNNVLDRGKKTSESFYLWKLFSDTYRGFTVDIRTAAEMEKLNLQRYSAVVLCDIPQLTPAGVQKLESYLNAGGGVGFFMGSSIRDPKFYNDQLYKDGKGMFPVPLKEVANKNATTEQLNQILFDQRISLNKKLLIRDEIRKHPAMEKLYYDTRGQLADKIIENLYYGVCIAKYYIVDRSKWNPGDETKTLLYLPNNRSIADFEKQTKDLLKKLRETTDINTRRAQLQQQFDETKDEERRQELQKLIDDLPSKLEKYAKYAKTIREYSDIISNTVGKYDNPLHKLVVWMDVLLEDPGDTNTKPPLPSMVEFWQAPELSELKQEFRQLQDVIKFGDPFYISKQYRKGRVLAFLGAAGTSGPEGDYWSSLRESGAGYFPILMKDSLQRWLCAASGDLYLGLGAPFDFELESASYEPLAIVRHAINNESVAVDAEKVVFGKAIPKNLDVVADSPLMNWRFADGTVPGMYLFEFTPKADPGKKEIRPEYRALAYNFDTRIESNLLRARTDDLTTIARVSKIDALDEASKPKAIARESEKKLPKEEGELGWSKSPWLYLGLLLALIFEQAMAVRLSFHIRGNASGPAVPQAITRGPVVA